MTALNSLRDTMTMFRRDALHALRNPMFVLSGLLTPVVMLLLFDGVLGAAMSKALGARGTAGSYIDYLTPGIILMAVGSGVSPTAINVTIDKSGGMFARFRTMGIARTSVLTGQVIGSVIRTVFSIVIVFALALLLGFRTTAGPVQLLEAFGVVVMLTVALTWLGVAVGLFSSSVAGANSLALIPQFLPLISSAFVPTDAMPVGVRWFAENQPYTPVIETLRGLLIGSSAGNHEAQAILWCVVIGAAGYLWSRHLYNRDPSLKVGRTSFSKAGSEA